MKEIYNVLEDLFRRCLKKSNVFSFYFERYESKSLALKTPNQNTSIWVFLKQIMLVGKCRLLILLCNRLFVYLFVCGFICDIATGHTNEATIMKFGMKGRCVKF